MNEYRIENGYAVVKLTKGYETKVDLADLPLVLKKRWCVQGVRRKYAVTNLTDDERAPGMARQMALHIFLMRPPLGMDVDHEKGDTLDNRRSELRVCTRGQNLWNQAKRPGRSSQFKGVGFSKQRGRWRARIKQHYRETELGFFLTEEEAALAYDTAARKLFGDFARTNFN